MSLRHQLIRIHHLFSEQLGLDPLRLWRFLRALPGYLRNLKQFRKGYRGNLRLVPSLHDRDDEGGATHSEYFWQDLLVARMIFEDKPKRHVDVGSRVDGFVAHVASFREIEVLDVRPIHAQIPGVVFRQADLMRPPGTDLPAGYCDSLSCLHAIEHFGLGRYGDPIDPQGYESGIASMARILKPDGRFYLSTPIGKERVDFDANRVFDPRSIIRCVEASGLTLQGLSIMNSDGVMEKVGPNNAVALLDLSRRQYNLCLFFFIKQARKEQKGE